MTITYDGMSFYAGLVPLRVPIGFNYTDGWVSDVAFTATADGVRLTLGKSVQLPRTRCAFLFAASGPGARGKVIKAVNRFLKMK